MASTDAMDVDEMDIDLGLDVDVDVDLLQAEEVSRQQEAQNKAGAVTLNPDAQEDKIHIRGLDNLATEDIRQFTSEHFPPEYTRVEWIDDTSANIQYDSAQLAYEALANFTDPSVQVETLDTLVLRRAKQISTHPHVELQIRIALLTDVKKPRAHDSSRFYLLNPDKDPRERRRHDGDRRGGRRDYRDRRQDKRAGEEDDAKPFDVNLYDDDPGSLAARITTNGNEVLKARQTSGSPGHRPAQRRRRSESPDELFSRGSKKFGNGRLRDRSASPTAGGDGRLGFEETDGSRMRRARRRSFTPPAARLARSHNAGNELFAGSRNPVGKELMSQSIDNSGRELMDRTAPRQQGVLQHLGQVPQTARELFPTKVSPPENGDAMELFPSRTIKHRRSRAFDAADGTGDLFADRLTTPLRNGSDEPRAQPRTLADRIPPGNTNNLSARITGPDISGSNGIVNGFSIRGASAPDENPGFSIRGVAGLNNPRVKELFPDRTESSNEGKELFGRIKGRKRAEDLFT